VQRFVGLRLTDSLTDPLPDGSTIVHFRHLLEQNGMGQGSFEEIRHHL
jgi:IS5 family transposase